MCELISEYDQSCSHWAEPPKPRRFTVLLLYCWQREYDKRPYENFQFRRLEFQERMNRKYHCIKDLRVIVKFLLQKVLTSVSITAIFLSAWDAHLLKEFARSLIPVTKIELKLMLWLPKEFFVMLRLNADKMVVKELSFEGEWCNKRGISYRSLTAPLLLPGTPLIEENVNMLREFLLVNKTLHSLNVSYCSLTQFNFATIADGVYKSNIINFYVNRLLGGGLTLDSEKITSIMGSLLMQNRLVELSMQLCELTAQDMEIFAEYISMKKCTLRKLILAHNKIAADGAFFLMRGISQGDGLELLDIRSNSIGPHGGKWVAKYFGSCLALQHIYLDDNQIDAIAVNMILLTLKKRCRLHRLQLLGNHFDTRTAVILRRLLDADVLLQQQIDITYTYDEALQEYRVLPFR